MIALKETANILAVQRLFLNSPQHLQPILIDEQFEGMVDLYFPQLVNGSAFNIPAYHHVKAMPELEVQGGASSGQYSLIGVSLKTLPAEPPHTDPPV